MLQKFDNKFPSYTFLMTAIHSVLEEVKLPVNEVKITNSSSS